MGLRIQTNVGSLNARRNLNLSTDNLNSSMQKLASGYRINKAADDAAGLAISEKMKADIRSLNMAQRNASDGISLLQTAEGAMNEISNILIRLRELSIQGASDTIGNNEREFLNKEFLQLKDEIDRITRSTEFNGTMLLIGNQDNVPDSLSNSSNPYPLEIQIHKNFYQDIDSEGTGQTPINLIRIDLQNINTSTLGNGGLDIGGSADPDGSRVDSKASAQQSIAKLDSAINKVSGYRSYLGAMQSRLTSTVRNLAIQTENITEANSRIRDTDVAEEVANMTKYNILNQAGISILSQANVLPQNALRLLG